MTADPETLERIANIIHREVPTMLSSQFVANDVTADNLPVAADEDMVRRGVRHL